MGRAIIKIKDYYLIWSSVVDAPVSFGMNRVELEKWLKEEYGRAGLSDWLRMIPRVDEIGTSFYERDSVEDTIDGNRAGPMGACLTLDEIYTAYCLQEPIRDGWKPSEDEV